MNSEPQDRGQADDARLEAGLREVLGGEQQPDLRAVVLRRVARSRQTRGLSRWLAAAVVLAGAAVVALAVQHGRSGRAPAESVQQGQNEAEDATWISADQLSTLPPSTPRLRVYYPSTEPWMPTGRLAGLAPYHELRDLEVTCWGNPFADDELVHLSALTKLQRLRVCGSAITGRGVASLATLPMLEELDLPGSPVDADGLRAIARLPNLQRLDLGECSTIDGEAAKVLCAMRQLRSLRLRHLWHMPKAGFLALAELFGLEELDLGDNDGGKRSSRFDAAGDGIGVDDEVLAALSTLPRLRRLSLDRCFNVSVPGMAVLAKYGSLRDLDLAGLSATRDAALAAAPAGLTALGLGLCEVDTALIDRVAAKFRDLETLDVSFPSASAPLGLQSLGELPNLHHLVVRDGKTALGLHWGMREHLEPVPVLRHLRWLELEGCTVLSVADCVAIAALPELERLHLGGITALDDARLGALAGSRSLRRLELGDRRAWTPAGLKALREVPLRDLVLGGAERFNGDDAAAVVRLAAVQWPQCRLWSAYGVPFRVEDAAQRPK